MSLEEQPGNIQAPKFWFLCSISLISGGVLASSIWVFTPYSFWLDELYSVTAANEGLSSLHSIILSDVHPPLYPVMLKLWVMIFGDSELSTRALSLGFALAAAIYLHSKTSKYGTFFCTLALLFFTTNWLFSFYANEVRAYSMMLFFATLLATNIPSENKKPSLMFYASSFLLSLTHYFGFLMTVVTLVVYALRQFKQPRLLFPVFSVGVLCVAWPIYHMITGDLLNKTDGNFWIKVDGVLDSFRIAATAYVPKTEKIGGAILFLGLLFAAAITRRNSKTLSISNYAFLAHANITAIISLIFLVLVAVIDFWSPMSTVRNYIVLLPFLSLSLAGTFVFLTQKYPKTGKIFLSLLIVYCSLALMGSFRQTYVKSIGIDDWRGASLFIKNNHDSKNIYFIMHDKTNMWKRLVANFYLKKFSNGELNAKPYVIGKTKLELPAIILVAHLSDNQVDKLEKEIDIFAATQSYKRGIPIDFRSGSVGVYLTN